jgi:glycosyltransferase involved in cell wall biosynthesis
MREAARPMPDDGGRRLLFKAIGPVAIFLPSLAGGGAERMMVTIANGFAERGVSVDLVLVHATGPNLEYVRPTVTLVDLGAVRATASIPGLARYLRRRKPAVVLAALDQANVAALLARRLARTRTPVVVSHRNDPRWTVRQLDGIRRAALRTLGRRLYRRAAGHIAVSHGVADATAEQFDLPRSSIATIYNPVVSPQLHTRAAEEPQHRFFGAGRAPVIVAAGRLTAQKDFATLLRAFAELRGTTPATLIILGEGELRARLEALSRQLGLGDSVDLPGFVGNPYGFMRRASVFVLSSVAEGLPNVLVEAMACGTPIVSTDCPFGPAEILEGGRWGRLVPVGDASALAAAMRLTLEDDRPPDVTVRANDFDVDSAVEAYLALLSEVVRRS